MKIEGIFSGITTEELLLPQGEDPAADDLTEQVSPMENSVTNGVEQHSSVADDDAQRGFPATEENDLHRQDSGLGTPAESQSILTEQFTNTLRAANGPPSLNSDGQSVTENGSTQSGGSQHRSVGAHSIPPSENQPFSVAKATSDIATQSVGSHSEGSPRVLRPGNSPGLMTFNNPEIWSPGESYEWEINDLTGQEGPVPPAPGWDLIEVKGTLDIQATVANPFVLKLATHDIQSPQPLPSLPNTPSFDTTKPYAWRILKSQDGIVGFDRSKIQIDTTSFKNALGSGAFVLDLVNGEHDLVLRFLPNSPSTQLDLSPSWTEQGPSQIKSSEKKEGIISGAISAIAVHPFKPDIIFVGAASGGVWRTENGTSPNPTWTPLGQSLPSLATGALVLSPYDRLGAAVGPNTQMNDLVLYFGTGSFSSTSIGVARLGAVGIFKSTDGGQTWSATGTSPTSALLAGYRVSSILTSPTNKDVVFVGTADASTLGGGLYKSSDAGATWVHLSGQGGLGFGSVTDLELDPGYSGPANSWRFYVSLAGKFDTNLDGDFGDEDAANPGNGIYRSEDVGVSWVRADTGIRTDDDFDNADTDKDGNAEQADGREGLKRSPNIELAVSPLKLAGSDNPIFAVIIGTDNRPAGVFRSTNAGGNWTPLGSRPGSHGGNQGMIHLSLAADPVDPNVVYLGGDVAPNVWRGDARTAGLVTFSLDSTDSAFGPSLSLPFVPVSVMDGTATPPPPGLPPGNPRGFEDPYAKIGIVESHGKTVVIKGGQPDSYTVVLPSAPAIDVRVNLKTGSGLVAEDSANAGRNYLVFTTTNWNVPQTVNVRALDDGQDDTPKRNLVVEHTVLPADPDRPDHLNFDLPEVSATVIDPDAPGITVVQDPSLSVSETTPADVFVMVTLNHAPTANVRVHLHTNGQVTAADTANPGQTFLDFTPSKGGRNNNLSKC